MKRFFAVIITLIAMVLPAAIALIVLGPETRFEDLRDGGAVWIVGTVVGAFVGSLTAAYLRRSEGDSTESIVNAVQRAIQGQAPRPRRDGAGA
jgi:hypothetical protein